MDWDGDGIGDIIAGDADGYVSFVKRTPGGELTVMPFVQGPDGPIQVYNNAAPVVTDWNADGLPDLVIGSFSGYPAGIHLYLNSGDPWNPVFADSTAVYAAGSPLVTIRSGAESETILDRKEDLESWNRFWGLADTGSLLGVIRFQGGDLRMKAKENPQQLMPEDFRLTPDSAGHRAGPDGKDLGADVDLVGPGEAYERWKKTPEYQEWHNQLRELIEASNDG